MPYVVRDPSGQISEVHNAANNRAHEELESQDPDLQRFLSKAGGHEVQGALGDSDLGLVRVLEDLIATLIDKRIIALTDLPEAAQKKLAHRYSLRSRLADLQGIVGDQDEILLP
jgi:hypothetical protein